MANYKLKQAVTYGWCCRADQHSVASIAMEQHLQIVIVVIYQRKSSYTANFGLPFQ